jgi:peroxiredoxin 2/4
MFNNLKINCPAPSFELEGYFKDKVTAYTNEGNLDKWLILFFYPSDFGVICPLEIKELQNSFSQISSLSCNVLGISTDSTNVHKAWAKDLGGLDFPLLSDVHHACSIDYNVFIDDKAKSQRGTFIIDDKGILRWYQVSDNKIQRAMQPIIETLTKLQSL